MGRWHLFVFPLNPSHSSFRDFRLSRLASVIQSVIVWVIVFLHGSSSSLSVYVAGQRIIVCLQFNSHHSIKSKFSSTLFSLVDDRGCFGVLHIALISMWPNEWINRRRPCGSISIDAAHCGIHQQLMFGENCKRCIGYIMQKKLERRKRQISTLIGGI